MTTQYTSLLGLALPVEGELDGTWGNTVNEQITQLVEDAVAGYATASVTSGNWTLTTTGSGAQNESRMAVLIPTGTPGVSRNIIAPSHSKAYFVINQSDAVVVLKGSATTGVSVSSGKAAVCAWNGSDFIIVSDLVGPASSTDTAIPTFNGTSGKLLQNNSGATISAGVISASGFTTNAEGPLRLSDNAGGQYVGLKAPATVASSVTWTLPGTDGTNGQTLVTNGSGTLSWSSGANGDVVGPASAVSGNIAAFDGTTGKLLLDSGKAYPTGVIVGTTDSQTLTNKTIENGTFTNGYTEESVTANTSTAYTVDLANGTLQILTLTGNCTFTFPTATAGKSFMILLKQDSTGGRTATWPASVKWPSNTAPTITSTASKGDKLVFTADGTYWWGTLGGQNYL